MASTRVRILPTLVILAATLVLLSPAGRAEDAGADRPVDEKARAAELIAAFKHKDLGVRAKAAEAASSCQHESLTTPLIRLLGDDTIEVREAALGALAARTGKSARRKAATALQPRLKRLAKHPADRQELLLVIETLGALGQTSSIKALLDDIKLDTEEDLVSARLYAVAGIAHADAFDALVKFLDRGHKGGAGKQRGLANKALHWMTGARLSKKKSRGGRDADRWRQWWRDNKKTFSFEDAAAARAEAEAAAAEKAERKKKAREERKKKLEERKNKKKKPEKPKPPRID